MPNYYLFLFIFLFIIILDSVYSKKTVGIRGDLDNIYEFKITITMSNKSTTIMKISLRLYNKFYSELTIEQQDKVLDIYYDFY